MKKDKLLMKLVLIAGLIILIIKEVRCYTLSSSSFIDKLKGGWVGQLAGVTWGAPTEFVYQGRIIPDNEVPVWQPDGINSGFWQDDLYVEIPFINTMKDHGINCNWVVFGEHFRDTQFPLWIANNEARNNLRNGILAPDSGHYSNNSSCEAIDWQIEADFAGQLCPGQVTSAIDLSWRAGHVICFGDGVYGGVFVAAMHSAAYTAANLSEIIEAGRQSVPAGSTYRQIIEDVINWHSLYPADWKQTWQQLENKWNPRHGFNIDAKLNGAYVLVGLLYGNGDIEQSMQIAMQCGQDSDCNPSSVGGILGNWLGYSGIPVKIKSAFDSVGSFSESSYTFDVCIDVCVNLARKIMLMTGGSVSGAGQNEVWTIPQQAIIPPILEKKPAVTNAKPNLIVSTPSINGCTVSFAASAADSDGIIGYEWFFGDFFCSTGSTVTHTYLKDGKYTAICYVTDGIGNTAWKTIDLTFDFSSPAIRDVVSDNDGNVTVYFTKQLDDTAGQYNPDNILNYNISGEVSVVSARLQSDKMAVNLATTQLLKGQIYTLSVYNLRGVNQQIIFPNPTAVQFTPVINNFALQYNGTDNYVYCGDADSNLDINGSNATGLTIEMRVYRTRLAGAKSEAYLARCMSGTGNGGGYWVGIDADKFKISTRTNGTWYEQKSSIDISTGSWMHMAAVLDGNRACIYSNGIDVSLNPTASIPMPSSESSVCYMGSDMWGNASGVIIDEVRISNSARYLSNFIPATKPFTSDSNTKGLWHFDEGVGAVTQDMTGDTNAGILIYNPLWVQGYSFIGSSQPVLSVNPSSINFGSIEQGQSGSNTFNVSNSGAGSLSGTITSNRSWVAVTPSSFVIPAQAGVQSVAVTVNTTGLTTGTSTGTIAVTSNGGNVTVNVTVNVTQPSAQPQITISSSSLSFGELEAGAVSATKVLTITNSGGGSLTGTIITVESWIKIDNTSFVIAGGASQPLNVSVDNSVLSQKKGPVKGGITITSNGNNGAQATTTISVEFTATCVLVKPNPFSLSSPLAGEGGGEGVITFFGDGIVPGKTTIKIYTLSGTLVFVIPASEPESSSLSLRGALATWQSLNEISWTPSNLAPGIYLYVYESPREKGIGKLTIIK